MLAERVADCHVECMNLWIDGTDSDAVSTFASYQQAAGMVSEIKALLAAKIKSESELTPNLHNLKGLSKTATLSLARISLKQGCVSSKANDHYPALVSHGYILCLKLYCF